MGGVNQTRLTNVGRVGILGGRLMECTYYFDFHRLFLSLRVRTWP